MSKSPPKASPFLPRRTGGSHGHRQTTSLTSQQLDLWGHAALLYHGYEWQTAADIFVLLSQEVHNARERTICLMNAGLIYARLGDYDWATSTLEDADGIDPTFSITVFLMALLSCELRDYCKAEHCFELCWTDLACLDATDYKDYGLQFPLDWRSILRQNLVEARRAQFRIRFPKVSNEAMANIDTIPAEYIFEPPQRPKASPQTMYQHRRPSRRLKELSQSLRAGILTDTPSPRITNNSKSPTLPSCSLGLPNLRSPLSRLQDQLQEVMEESTTANSYSTLPKVEDFSSSKPASGNTDDFQTRSRRTLTPYVPRDARGECESSRELVSFIRSTEKAKCKPMVPRDARGEYMSLEELTRFCRRLSKNGRGTAAELLKPDPRAVADPQVDGTLNSEEDDNDTDEHALLDSPPSRAASNSPPPSPQSVRRETLIELLQPTVYAPPNAEKGARRSSKDTPSSFGHTAGVDTPPTTASSSSSYYKSPGFLNRPVRARMDSLRSLEGPPREAQQSTGQRLGFSPVDKPLPPDPGGGHEKSASRVVNSPRSGNSVSTDTFFDEMLKRYPRDWRERVVR